jgi:predicted N-formylglutamate amidohydrolase
MQPSLLITCEHGGHRVPVAYASCFRSGQRVLRSHRGYDAGALELARRMARQLGAPLFASTITRLLVELNRSIGHPQLFSEFSRHLDEARREQLLRRYYQPHRRRIRDWLARTTRRNVVVHVAVHSFTPTLHGQRRRADVGLLYDPRRAAESCFCRDWQLRLRRQGQDLVVRRNYPYQGRADGLTTWLRRQFPERSYLGLELEVNQSWVRCGGTDWQQLQSNLIHSLQQTVQASCG